jgi:hypothetical protein
MVIGTAFWHDLMVLKRFLFAGPDGPEKVGNPTSPAVRREGEGDTVCAQFIFVCPTQDTMIGLHYY